MLLRNFDCATKYFDYESKTEINVVSNPHICGWYKHINGLLSALLVRDNNLYFLLRESEFLITDVHRAELKKKSNVRNEFTLLKGKDELASFSYTLPDPKLNVSPFEYIDEADFNWGDFIEKIINNSERKKNFIVNLMESR